jgi:hypothetical protein
LLAKEAGVSLTTVTKHKDLLVDSSNVSSLDKAAKVECPNVEAANQELSVLPHLIVKRCGTRFKVTKPKLVIKVKGLKITYQATFNPLTNST